MRADQSKTAGYQSHNKRMTSYASMSLGRATHVRCHTAVMGLPMTGRTRNRSVLGGSKRAPLYLRSD